MVNATGVRPRPPHLRPRGRADGIHYTIHLSAAGTRTLTSGEWLPHLESNQEPSRSERAALPVALCGMARREGLEPPSSGFGIRRSTLELPTYVVDPR